MGNQAVDVNPPILNGVLADIHITNRGSDWLWTVFSIFGLSTLVFLFLGFRRPATDRIFHYITTAIVAVAAIAYFTLASDLGFVPIQVEFQRGGKVSGNFRQVFYVRYIDWAITTPLLLLDLLLTAALPWSHILFVIFMDLVMIICGLVGALVASTYKWGYFTLGCAAFLYVAYTLVGPARAHAAYLGSDVSRAYNTAGVWLVFLWFLYPIAWGCAEGGNVITPDSEAVFYGILDLLAKVGFGAILLWGHRGIDPARLGLRLRAHDEQIPGAARGPVVEKNGHGPAANV
jgi:bacteriorhodopsin